MSDIGNSDIYLTIAFILLMIFYIIGNLIEMFSG